MSLRLEHISPHDKHKPGIRRWRKNQCNRKARREWRLHGIIINPLTHKVITSVA